MPAFRIAKEVLFARGSGEEASPGHKCRMRSAWPGMLFIIPFPKFHLQVSKGSADALAMPLG